MRNGKYILGSEDIKQVWALLPSRTRPQESLDEAFFRTAVELAVLRAKLTMTGRAFRAQQHAYILEPDLQPTDEGLRVTWRWLAAEDAYPQPLSA
jgi:hypothetical protein